MIGTFYKSTSLPHEFRHLMRQDSRWPTTARKGLIKKRQVKRVNGASTLQILREVVGTAALGIQMLKPTEEQLHPILPAQTP